jgi:hypothetical protein
MPRPIIAIIVISVGVVLCGAPAARAGADPGAICTQKKAKAAGKKAADVLKAFGKNEKKPSSAKLAQDISKAQSKFTKSFTKEESKGGCETSGDASIIEGKVDAFAAEIAGELTPACGDDKMAGDEECDGADDTGCPGLCQLDCTCGPGCGNGVVEGSEQCDPPCEQGACAVDEVCNGFCQCEAVAPCDCGAPDPPTLVRYINNAGVGNCGVAENATGTEILDLACNGLYIGGGGGDLPVPAINPDQGVQTYSVTCCNGTSLTTGHTTPADVGIDACSGAGCFFGQPQPIINFANLFLSTCLINTVARNTTGATDCDSGDLLSRVPVDSNTHLRGIDFSDEPGWQSCPICVGGTLGVPDSGLCEGGPNDGLLCQPGTTQLDLHDCCDGGTKNGQLCTDDSECPGASCVSNCSAHSTSHDCPPNSINSIGSLISPFAFTTGTSTKTANPNGTFCGFCRDVNIEGSSCFDGDPDPGTASDCPNSVAQPTCQPESGSTNGCGTPIPCTDDSDCTAPYETCEQRNPGAFRNGTIRFLREVGTAGGDLRDRQPKAATTASVFCIEPSFTPAIDASADLPGPGATTLPGTVQVLPEP